MRARLVLPFTLALATILTLPAATLAEPLAAQGGEQSELDGLNAVVGLTTFATGYPARFGDTPTMERARGYLSDELAAMGYEVIHHRYGGASPGTNIVGILRGMERPHDWTVLSAHYDTVMLPSLGATAQGAWDNGAGVAAVLEMARVAAQREWTNTFAVAFFDDEELGLVGSQRFVGEYEGKSWEGGTIRLVANVNLDPPGLNWPCAVEGVHLPLTTFQVSSHGQGRTILRVAAFEAREAEAVPDNAFQYFDGGSTQVGVLRGTSDNAVFGWRGIPEIYIGSSTHLSVGNAQPLPFMYPLHTPVDTVALMMTYCPAPVLAEGFGVAMRVGYAALEAVDSYGGAFPRP